MISVVGDGLGVTVADRFASSAHAHHGTALVVGVDGDVTVELAGTTCSGRVVVVPPDVEHVVRAEGPVVGILYDAEANARVTTFARDVGLRVFEGAVRDRILGTFSAHRAALFDAAVVGACAREVAREMAGPAPRRDRRVARALEAIDAGESDHATLVGQSGLSEAHLQALFVRDVGLPMRAYRLWRRTLAATLALRAGDVTWAAHAAGFADLAHFSRSCRRTLGLRPSTMRLALASTARSSSSAADAELRMIRQRCRVRAAHDPLLDDCGRATHPRGPRGAVSSQPALLPRHAEAGRIRTGDGAVTAGQGDASPSALPPCARCGEAQSTEIGSAGGAGGVGAGAAPSDPAGGPRGGPSACGQSGEARR